MAKISVLMPVYNRAHLVKNAVQSIIDQTYEDWELVIIDDGSNDATWYVLRDLQDRNSKIKPYKIRHMGLARALNEGHKYCSGEIIVKQDSDDVSLPNRLQRIADYFDKNPNTDLLYHGMYQKYSSDEPGVESRAYIPALPLDKSRLFKEQYIPGCYAYKPSLKYRELICSEDWMFILDAVFSGKNVGYIDEGLYEYILREDSNSMIHENTGAYEDDEIVMRSILDAEYKLKGFKYAERK